LDRGSSNPGTFVGLRIDVDNSQDTLAQWDDYGFFVGEDGTPFTVAGDGLGGFGGPGPGGVSARVTATDAVWRAELRIDAAVLGDSSHAVRIAPGHYGVTVEGDDYQWPYLAAANQPPTWALTALGDWPQMEGITPGEAPVGSAALTLTVTGTHLVDGTVVYWDEIPLPTTVMSSSQLTAEIAATRLATAGTFEVAVVAPGLEDAPSQPQLFTVKNPVPVITGLSPDAVPMGAPAFALTVEGTGFVEGAAILWDGIERPTTFVNATQLQAAVGATDLVPARTIGIRVRNPSPGGGGSNTEMFAIQAPGGLRVFLPLIAK
jgi:hypothetical protein